MKPLYQLRPLTWAERLEIVDALCLAIDGAYAHLPLKRSLYGFDIMRGFAQLRVQLSLMTDLQFHRELTTLINRLRDAHTQYYGPWETTHSVASLPFLIESFGPASNLSYVVSKVDRRSVKDPQFVPGVVLDYWNGVPFDRAIDLHAESETGGRPDSRRARAVQSLTFRSLEFAPPPNEEWVVVGYRDLKGQACEITLRWRGLKPGRAPTAAHTAQSRLRTGINQAAEVMRRGRKVRFSPVVYRMEGKAKTLRDKYSDALASRAVLNGKYGYLRIWTFDVEDDDEFIEAVTEHINALPQEGLILDLRANPGGVIWSAERLLQLFTPNRITPTRFALRATAVTASMARAAFNQDELAPWSESLSYAELSGEPYSTHLPITSVEQCNDLGQRYGGPVVAVVDANTYSSGDLFAAGIADNRIGPVVCIGEATGAGGANVWSSDDMRASLEPAGYQFPKLPKGASFTMAFRRAVRSGDADGTLIEDAGIPGIAYAMTRDDIFNKNVDLISFCGSLLDAQPKTNLSLQNRRNDLVMETAGLDRLDVYLEGHPVGPSTVVTNGQWKIELPRGWRQVDVVGFTQGRCVQRRRITRPK